MKRTELDPDQPHPFWASLRAQCPVVAADSMSPGGRPLYYVASWSDANAVLRDPQTFSSSINAEGTGQFMGRVMIAMDGDDHRSHRSLRGCSKYLSW